jgi:alpha-L-rhamnosidase
MTDFTVEDLRCEYRRDPLGIDNPAPRLSWRLSTSDPARRGLAQSAYQVLAATRPDLLTDGRADLWDSGKVASDQSVLVPYAGRPLRSGERAYWTVRAWGEQGNVSDAAPAAFFEAGLPTPADWAGAEWIGGGLAGGPRTSVPAPMLRRVFTLDAVPEGGARLYVSALGLHRVTLNGQHVGADELAPGWTDYKKRVQYQTYDVTGLLRPGRNVLAATLGDGWYSGHVEWRGRQRYGDRPLLLACVKTAGEGGEAILTTGTDWKAGYGPLLQADLLMGEHYDARRETPGWDTDPDFDDSGWLPAAAFPAPAGMAVVAQQGPTVRAFEELTPVVDPVSVPKWPAPDYLFDFGQNLVGRVRLRVKGPAGATVRLRFAETLKDGPAAPLPGGGIYTENLRSADQTDYYTLKGDPDGETWEPAFTFHGFRYVEAVGLPEPPTRETLTAVVLHSDTPKTGDFECSDPLVNQLQKNIDWGQRGNYVDIPTDCPQRDERLGWTGDAQVFVRTAAFNRDVAGFFHKWLQDLEDAQAESGSYPSIAPDTAVVPGDGGPAWADAGIICPWTVYQCYGDAKVLADRYESMKRFLAYLESTAVDGIRCPLDSKFHCYGDWLALDGSGRTEGGTPKDLIGTAFLAHDARLMAKVATVLGRPDDAAHYEKLFDTTRAAFRKRFVTGEGLIIPGTQTAYVLALHFDLLPPDLRPGALEALVRDIERRGNKLSTGFVGSPYLPHVLTENGRLDVAYRLLHQKGWPSYLYAVTQGATTIWERWDGWTHDKGFQTPGMNSFNHYAYGAIGSWLYEKVAGLDGDEVAPGYKKLVLRPRPEGSGLTHARAHLDTVYGRAESAWRLPEGRGIEWDVTVPPNTTATAYVPAAGGASSVTENGAPASQAAGVTPLRDEDGRAVFSLAPGTYRFAAPYG